MIVYHGLREGNVHVLIHGHQDSYTHSSTGFFCHGGKGYLLEQSWTINSFSDINLLVQDELFCLYFVYP